MKAWLNLRYTVPERLKAFVAGIERHGYRAEIGLPIFAGRRDVLVTWNRIGRGDLAARQFQEAGQTVIVAENAAWGNDFLGRRWYSLAWNYHNSEGCYPHKPGRWERLGFELAPFREEGSTIILPQRGIGSPPVRMPTGWAESAYKRYGGRIRAHPGRHDRIPIERDLNGVGRAITWGSGAAIKALMMGVKVTSEMPNWIGEQQNTEATRLNMFRRLASCQWELHEIESGEAFACLLPA